MDPRPHAKASAASGMVIGFFECGEITASGSFLPGVDLRALKRPFPTYRTLSVPTRTTDAARANKSGRLQRAPRVLATPRSGREGLHAYQHHPASCARINALDGHVPWFHPAFILERRDKKIMLATTYNTRARISQTMLSNLPPRRFAAAAFYFPLARTPRSTRCFIQCCASPKIQ